MLDWPLPLTWEVVGPPPPLSLVVVTKKMLSPSFFKKISNKSSWCGSIEDIILGKAKWQNIVHVVDSNLLGEGLVE